MIPSLKLQFHYGTKTIEYSIIKSKRIKTSEIAVDANSVVVRTPLHKPVSEVHDIVRKKADWIVKKQREYRVNGSQIIKPTFQHDSTLPYLGKNYPLHIISNVEETGEKINFVDGEFLVHISGIEPSKKKIKLLYEKWLVNTTVSFIERKIEFYSKELGVATQKFKLKKFRGRWGSITIYR